MNYSFEDMTDEELQKSAEEFEMIEDEINNLEENDPLSVPKELDKKMLKMIRDFECIELKKNRKKKLGRCFRIAAMLIFCIGVGMTVVTMNVDAFRIKLFNFLIEDHSEYIDVNIVEKGELSPEIKAKFPEDWDSVFYPMALPEGYEIDNAEEFATKDLYFLKRDNKNLSIRIAYRKVEENNLMINSEDAEVGETEVNGKDAVYSLREGCIILVWSESGYEFSQITYDIGLEQAVKIAESIVYIKLK